MTAAVLLRGGLTLYRVSLPEGPVASLPLDGAEVEVAAGYASPVAERAARWARAAPGAVTSPDAALRERFGRAGLEVGPTPRADLRRALARLPPVAASRRRAAALALARARLARALASEEETLIALAREEERVERALGRESGALAQFLAGPTGALAEYKDELAVERDALARHHARLVERLDREARKVVPNLSELLGSRVAARLVAAVGDRRTLSRISASRLQLLGARRRPQGGHGPRFGLIFRAARMVDVPLDRQGRYARSLAALAVIAARADELTHRDLSEALVARRDRRIRQLQRRP